MIKNDTNIIDVFQFAHETLKKNFLKNIFFIYFFLVLTGFFYFSGIFSVIPLVTILVAPEVILNNEIIDNGNFKMIENLDASEIIDRDLVKWKRWPVNIEKKSTNYRWKYHKLFFK
mgnify:CR=1 FL=1